MTNGNVREYVDDFAAGPIVTPTKDWSWIDPEADPFTRTETEWTH